MCARLSLPTQLVRAVKPAIPTETGGSVVDVMVLPSVIALGAPSRLQVVFERDEMDRNQMAVLALRWSNWQVSMIELDTPWAEPFLATLAAALGAEVRRRSEVPAFRPKRISSASDLGGTAAATE